MRSNKLRSWVIGCALTAVLPVTAAAAPPDKLFAGKSQRVPPGQYAKAAIATDIDVTGPQAGRKSLLIQLPDGREILLERTSFESRGSSGAAWRGVAPDYPGSEATLTIRQGRLFGRLLIDNEVLEIRPVAGPARRNGGAYVVEVIDTAALPACDVSGFHGVTPTGDYTAAAASLNNGYPLPNDLITVDVLSVYTPAVRARMGGAEQAALLIQAAVDAANTAFIESDMQIRYRLVHTAEIAYTTQGTTNLDLYWVTDDPAVAQLRNAYGADLVSIMVDTPNSCGTAWVQRSPGPWFADNGYAAVDMDCAVGGLTWAHEHGHNQGMEHNTENSSVGATPASASYPWSFGHYVNGSYRTVMSYSAPCTSGCPRAARFSNPAVVFNGAPAGVSNQHDNARTGDLTAAIIADFRSSVVSAALPGEVNVRVAQSNDDAEESINTGTVFTSGNDLEFGYDSAIGSSQHLGLRFVGIDIPTGANITSAHLEFAAVATAGVTTSAEIRLVDALETAAFSGSPYNVSTRPTGAPVVYWAMSGWSAGTIYQTPDLKALVQAAVDRPGWLPGGNMAFVISAVGDRTAASWDGSPTQAPLLHVEFEPLRQVSVDVLPGDATNVVYPNLSGRLPVAVLSDGNFDATQIDPLTLRFGTGQAAPAGSTVVEDVDGVNGADLSVRFEMTDSGIACYDTEVALTGETFSGEPFVGVDYISASDCDGGSCHAY